jgi:phosphoribosyl 1,2-cyclic phosphate phosphodiesterase
LNIDQALEVISQVRPKKAFLTHLSHDFDHTKWTRKLPKGVHLAYDGLKIRLKVKTQPHLIKRERKGSV